MSTLRLVVLQFLFELDVEVEEILLHLTEGRSIIHVIGDCITVKG